LNTISFDSYKIFLLIVFVQNFPLPTKTGVKSCILDCEVVAIDPATNKILPFQKLSTRARQDVSNYEVLFYALPHFFFGHFF
jgi:hypothetical protein